LAEVLQVVFREDILDEFLISLETIVDKIECPEEDGAMTIRKK
jgi:hypothetical protein